MDIGLASPGQEPVGLSSPKSLCLSRRCRTKLACLESHPFRSLQLSGRDGQREEQGTNDIYPNLRVQETRRNSAGVSSGKGCPPGKGQRSRWHRIPAKPPAPRTSVAWPRVRPTGRPPGKRSCSSGPLLSSSVFLAAVVCQSGLGLLAAPVQLTNASLRVPKAKVSHRPGTQPASHQSWQRIHVRWVNEEELVEPFRDPRR